jgi:hypothetical protein
MSISVPHKLTQDEAAARVRNLIEQLRGQFGNHASNLQESWNGYTGTYSFEVMGFAVSGKLQISQSDVKMDGQFPFAALPFKGRIEKTAREKLKELLA